MNENALLKTELGKDSPYDAERNPGRLCAIARAPMRQEINLDKTTMPFYGFDCWNHYEVSWLNPKGKPVVALGEIYYDCHTPNLVESKSLKLYFNSLNNTKFKDINELKAVVSQDILECTGVDIIFRVTPVLDATNDPSEKHIASINAFNGICIDELDVTCDVYTPTPTLLTTESDIVTETLYSNLLKSNCPITKQRDWSTVQIQYHGSKINHENLLQYLVSFRNCSEFHEMCIERIFADIMRQCKPQSLTVYGRYTRRGGLDINPYRSTEKADIIGKNIRLIRQ